jgi:hypothetical protein
MSWAQEFMRNPGGDLGSDTYETWEKTPNSTEELKILLGKAYLYNNQFAKSRVHLDDAMSRAKDRKSALAMCIKGHTHYIEQGWHLYRSDMEIPKASGKFPPSASGHIYRYYVVMSYILKCAGFPTPYETSTTMNGTIEDFYSKAMSPQTFKQPYIDVEEYYRLARVLIGNKPPKFARAQQELIKACRHTPSGM